MHTAAPVVGSVLHWMRLRHLCLRLKPRSTQYLLINADQHTEIECMWLWGILPDHMTVVKHTPPVLSCLHLVGQWPRGAWPAGTYYTDGTGCVCSSTPEVRRCGLGIAFLHGLDLARGCYLALPGVHQAVTALELFAVLLFAAMLAPNTAVTVAVDSMYVRDGIRLGQHGGALANMWDRLWDLTALKRISIFTGWGRIT